MDKQGQTGGLITGLVFGIASLVIGVIIAFVIITTINGAGLLDDQRVTTTVTNETAAWINATGYQLNGFNIADDLTPAITTVYNTTNETGGAAQGYNITILAGNYTVNGTGFVTNATVTNFGNVSISYTYVTKTAEELSANRLSSNMSSGVDNISSKIPTVLLVAAIVLLLAILAILFVVWTRMRMGGGTL